MPGFLNEYDETVTLKFGAKEEWWVRVRRYPTRSDFKRAQAALVRPIMRSRGDETETTGDVDTVGYQNELVVSAVEAWNFTDRDGVELPLEPDEAKRAAIDSLPEIVFEAISKAIEGITKDQEKEKAADTDGGRFPNQGPRRALPRGASAG